VNSSRSYAKRSTRSRRVRARRLLILGAVAIVIAAAAFLAIRHLPRSTPVALRAPLAMRTPSPVPWTRAQIGALRVQLDSAFAPAITGANDWSLCVMDRTGRVLYGRNARTALTAASVQKLIVATTALDVLGATYRYETVLAASAPLDGQTLSSDLWLVGSGDPSLRSEYLRAAAKALYRAGLRRIAGGVVADASAFKGPEINPFWNPADANEDFQAPTSAVSLDDGTIEFDVRGTKPGAAAIARVKPWSTAVHAQGDVTTVAADGDPSVIVAAEQAPNAFLLSGTVPAGAIDREWVPVRDAGHHAAAVMTQILKDEGVAVARQPEVATAPEQKTILWDHRSASLRVLLAHMLYFSDNHYAEQLLRTVGLVVRRVGDDADGLAVERGDLRARGVPIDGLHVVDGSGLADANRVSALTLATILQRALDIPQERGFYDLLPQGGRSGTVDGYDFQAARGRVRAKTGHLSGVSSLAGYVATRGHGVVAFAFTIDGSPADPDDAMVRAVDRISEF
jgi:serine-type D-Ala-D-Ala carboxypeptidase/endopeptidase (penicillin-binding protein 4)